MTWRWPHTLARRSTEDELDSPPHGSKSSSAT